MQVLLKKAKIIDAGSPLHQKRHDLLIKNGQIIQIAKNIKPTGRFQEISSKNLCVSIGFLDIGAQICEPGLEIREDMASISKAAFAGGYTALAPLPNTVPVIQHRSNIEFLINRGRQYGLDIFPIGALSADTKGADMTEMMDMTNAGAVAFSDGRKAVSNGGLMARTLEYVKSFDGLIVELSSDPKFAPNGQINEGNISTLMGMPGLPAMAEEIHIQRNLSLLKYTASKMHLRAISSEQSVSQIKEAKKDHQSVTADVSAFHLFYSDEQMQSFDAGKKVFPPFRREKDMNALKKAVKDGIIDHISSLHEPLEQERKKLEFPLADFGSIGLESAFAMAHTALHAKMELSDIVNKFTTGPRNILGLEIPSIREGEKANLTFFDPTTKWNFEESNIKSKSKNSAALGLAFIGRVIGVVNGNVFIY